MSDNGKRTYTVPVLLIIILVLLTLIFMFYSKLLLTQQTHTTDQGSRLAERYNYALLFVDQLHGGVEGLLTAKTEGEWGKAMNMLGKSTVAAGETSSLLVEAVHLTSDSKREEASKPIVLAINKLMGVGSTVATIGEHEGPLTDEEKDDLIIIRDGAAQMQEVLNRFRPPSGEAGFRQMVTVGDWITPALDSSKLLEQIAAKL
jgi:hypothetical protein